MLVESITVIFVLYSKKIKCLHKIEKKNELMKTKKMGIIFHNVIKYGAIDNMNYLKKIKNHHMNELLIVGENCLKQFLSKNPNSCPVESHDNCLYSQSRLAKRYIGELDVICPRQFEYEGETLIIVSCNFKGKIKQVNSHLENFCCLQIVKCWYESFGCNHTCLKSMIQDHLTSNTRLHFDLVIKYVETLKQTIQQQQVSIFFFFFLVFNKTIISTPI
ncbi:hypothetical protein RFI_18840 [Reticulomyxa filosa]|uniref:TRAF-type domain-containing protein n=1 Tax=Reticulomyxa filosa TaxID=46433 RepID=X6MZE9_RETFI|nr:hypothetical protein RFI_18840 [Reticulomyxa filosa]|eukprot:ETO18425.1 hypothetical protein RFI_18840 [Reticulomyxa filosa]